MRRGFYILLLIVALGWSSCHRNAMPKPYGYYRIAVPDTVYEDYAPKGYPYAFRLSRNAEVRTVEKLGEKFWIDVFYPTLNTTIHCSYKPIHGNNLYMLTRDVHEFLYGHSTMASAIPVQEYANAEEHVWGLYYELHGNTATPIQFVLTDSIKHFFRGSVYCNDVPNQDSLAPIYVYMQKDIRVLIESMKWR